MISKKKHRQLISTIRDTFHEMFKNPDFDCPPELWSEETRIKFDTIDEVERLLEDKIEKVIHEWSFNKN